MSENELTGVNSCGTIKLTDVNWTHGRNGTMRHITLSDGEWILMEQLWEQEPRTLANLVDGLKESTSWSKSTIYTMLKRLEEKGAVHVDDSGRFQQYYSCFKREEAQKRETENFLEKVYHGSLRMMLAGLTGKKGLSKADIDELHQFLDNMAAEQEE